MSEVDVSAPSAAVLRKEYKYVWTVGTGAKVTRGALHTAISKCVSKVMTSSLPLRIQAQLLLGLVRIYQYMLLDIGKSITNAQKEIVYGHIATEKGDKVSHTGLDTSSDEATGTNTSVNTSRGNRNELSMNISNRNTSLNQSGLFEDQNTTFNEMIDNMELDPFPDVPFDVTNFADLDAFRNTPSSYRPSIGGVDIVRDNQLAMTPDNFLDISMRQNTPQVLESGLDLSFLTSPIGGEKIDLMNLTRRLDLSMLTPAQMMKFLDATPDASNVQSNANEDVGSAAIPAVVRQRRAKKSRPVEQANRVQLMDNESLRTNAENYESTVRSEILPYTEVDPLLVQYMSQNNNFLDKKCKFLNIQLQSDISHLMTFTPLTSDQYELTGNRLVRFDQGKLEEDEEEAAADPNIDEKQQDQTLEIFDMMPLDDSLLGLLDTSDMQSQSPLERSIPPSPLSSGLGTPQSTSVDQDNSRLLGELTSARKRVKLSTVIDNVSSDIIVQLQQQQDPTNNDINARKLHAKRCLFASRTFIAMLTQLCEQKISIEQEHPYEEIYISSK